MNTKILKFKESMRAAMIENFKSDGYLNPILFFLKDDMPAICYIPDEYLSSTEGKQKLTGIIRKICNEPNVLAAGMIMEADAAKIDEKEDNELSKLLMNGDIRVSELKDKQDIIMMMFSTPESEDIIAYLIDIDKKKVNEKYCEDSGVLKGIFSDFFYWNKN